jgi:hypothetical protein
MSRAGFEMIARILKDAKPYAEGALPGWSAVVSAFARDLAATNPRFDRARFLAACGWGEGGKS